MINSTAPFKLKGALFVLPILLLVLSGCAGPKIASDLLVNVSTNHNPLVSNPVAVRVTITPHINNYEKLDESVKSSLEMALENANIFGSTPSKPYRINVVILAASQSPMSFGSFEGKLSVRYVVYDSSGNKVLGKTLSTVAGSDKWYFSGAARHRRSRAVNISKNVLQFVDILQRQLN